MNSMTIALIAFACIFGGALLGIFLNAVLPEHHLGNDSKDVVKLGAGTIATLAALVLGLLVGSAKTSFDTMNAGIRQAGAKMVQLDSVLARYGPETKAVRDQFRRAVGAGIERIWPKEKTARTELSAVEAATGIADVYNTLRELSPQNDSQRLLQTQALQIVDDLSQSRWLLIEQEQSALPTPFLVVLVFWLTILFASYGLFAPRNATVIAVLLVCSLSLSGAIFLILEMNRPLEGMIQISGAPLYKALDHLGK